MLVFLKIIEPEPGKIGNEDITESVPVLETGETVLYMAVGAVQILTA